MAPSVCHCPRCAARMRSSSSGWGWAKTLDNVLPLTGWKRYYAFLVDKKELIA